MAIVKPLVIKNGQIEQLQSGDAIAVSSYGGIYEVAEGETLTVPNGRILYTSQKAVTNGTLVISGILEVH